jgi:hypothetical protein
MTSARPLPRACAVVSTGARRTRSRAVRRLAEWAAWVERSSASLASAPDAVPVETPRGCAVTVPPREGCR